MGHFLWCTAVCCRLSDSTYNVSQKSKLELCLASLIVIQSSHWENIFSVSDLTVGQLKDWGIST